MTLRQAIRASNERISIRVQEGLVSHRVLVAFTGKTGKLYVSNGLYLRLADTEDMTLSDWKPWPYETARLRKL